MIYKVVLFLFLFFSSLCTFSAQKDLRVYFDIYQNILRSSTVHDFESYHSQRFNDQLKKFFKEKCGLNCTFLFSKSWVEDYEDFIFNSLYLRKEYIDIYSFRLYPKGEKIILVLNKRNCYDENSREEVVFLKEGSVWKVDEVNFSAWLNEDASDFPKDFILDGVFFCENKETIESQ